MTFIDFQNATSRLTSLLVYFVVSLTFAVSPTGTESAPNQQICFTLFQLRKLHVCYVFVLSTMRNKFELTLALLDTGH